MNKQFIYCRQFIITDSEKSFLDFWKQSKFSNLNIYTHPLLSTNYVNDQIKNIEIFLIGYIFNPFSSENDETEILNDIIKTSLDFNDLCKMISNLSGRFVLLLKCEETIYIFNDPCGLRSVYYIKKNNKIFIGSQPSIFSKYFELEKTENYFEFIKSFYYQNCLEFSLPGEITLYKDVHHLVPNHYLNLTTFKQYRFWPKEKIKSNTLEQAVNEISKLFSNLLNMANKRFELALALTGGYDSRTLLAFCKPFIKDVYIYTLKYRDLDITSSDIRIPRLITDSLKIHHNLLDCHVEMSQEFCKCYSANVDLYHIDWAKIAYGLYLNFPKNRVVLKGNCSEIVKCWYHNKINRKNVYSSSHLAQLDGWGKLNFIIDAIDLWVNDTKQICLDNNINILDIYRWEHRIGTCTANGQLEWDMVQEVFSPFNTRPILELMLGIDPKFRPRLNPVFLNKIIECSWKELTSFPVNPRELSYIMKNKLQYFLTKRNLYFR